MASTAGTACSPRVMEGAVSVLPAEASQVMRVPAAKTPISVPTHQSRRLERHQFCGREQVAREVWRRVAGWEGRDGRDESGGWRGHTAMHSALCGTEQCYQQDDLAGSAWQLEGGDGALVLIISQWMDYLEAGDGVMVSID